VTITTFFRDYSINNDEYGASDLARVFRSLFGSVTNSGPLKDALNELSVSHVSGRTVQVASGQGMIRGWWFENSESYQIALPQNDSSYDRIDRVVGRLTLATQAVSLTYIAGTPAVSPVVPSLVQNTTYWDVPLASTTMNASDLVTNIVDTREFCEFAHQLPHQHWNFLNGSTDLGYHEVAAGEPKVFDLTAYGVPSNSEAAYIFLHVRGLSYTADWFLSVYAGPVDNNYLVGTYRVHLTQGLWQNIVVPLREGKFYIDPDTGGGMQVDATLLAYRTD